MKALQSKLNIQEGTIIFVEFISNWFKMMHVKDKFSYQKLKDYLRVPWSSESEKFAKLQKICDMIVTCIWKGGKGHKKKLTRFTCTVFVITTKSAIEAAKHLFQEHNFQYVLLAVFSTNPVEKFFWSSQATKWWKFLY